MPKQKPFGVETRVQVIRKLLVIPTLIFAMLVLATPAQAHKSVLVVGDSLTVQTASRLRGYGYHVDARSGRRLGAAVGVLHRHPHHPTVVLALGTNGRVRLAKCVKIVRLAQPAKVYLLTLRSPRKHIARNNRALRACARQTGAVVIDWQRASARHPEWFKRDGTHLTKRGKSARVALIRRAIV